MCGAGNVEECAAELRARLPAPQLMGSCRAPYRLVLEVRRLRCETVAAPEAKRRFHLTDADLKRLSFVKVSAIYVPTLPIGCLCDAQATLQGWFCMFIAINVRIVMAHEKQRRGRRHVLEQIKQEYSCYGMHCSVASVSAGSFATEPELQASAVLAAGCAEGGKSKVRVRGGHVAAGAAEQGASRAPPQSQEQRPGMPVCR